MKFCSQPWLRRRRNGGVDGNLLIEEKGENSSRGPSDIEFGEEEREVERRAREGEGQRRLRSPPDDDVCPICYGSFTVPFRTLCGHWYCGGCIIQYWNHGAALRPCKCPICSQQITRMIPEASLDTSENVKLLEDVHKYNRLFAGGIYGFIMKVSEMPFLIKRMFRELMDPDAPPNHNILKVRIFAMLLGVIYMFSPFDFLPTERLDAISFFDRIAIALVLVLYLVGLYQRRRRMQNMRQLAAHNLEDP